MRTGQHKKKFFAACYVLHKQPKKNKKGEVIHDKTKSEPTAKTMEYVPKKTEVVFWDDESIDNAKAGLTKHMEEREYKIDEDRNANGKEMGIEVSVNRFKKKEDDRIEAERIAEEKAKAEAEARAKAEAEESEDEE